jgi:hypothetical protein
MSDDIMKIMMLDKAEAFWQLANQAHDPVWQSLYEQQSWCWLLVWAGAGEALL